jgi:hypothetical protein
VGGVAVALVGGDVADVAGDAGVVNVEATEGWPLLLDVGLTVAKLDSCSCRQILSDRELRQVSRTSACSLTGSG